MDDVLYDTSLTLYAVTESTAPLQSLLTADQNALSTKAANLRDHLSHGRAKYEDEEEHEKIGGLRDCTWELVQHEPKPPHGTVISLLYDKITYRFIFLAGVRTPATRQRNGQELSSLPLLLVKASTSVTARFLNFLTIHFQAPTIQPLQLPPTHLAATLSKYVSSLGAAHSPVAADHALQTFLQDTIGTIKLTITVTSADIAKNLRTIDVDVPTETLSQLVSSNSSESGHDTGSAAPPVPKHFLANLQHHIHQRTGLMLPLGTTFTTKTSKTTPEESVIEPPLKLTRLSTLAFALSSDPVARLKLSMRSVQAVEAVPGLDSGLEGNVVRRTNADLLESLISVAIAAAELQTDS